MKITNIALSILITAFLASCSSENKQVAQHKYGGITKGELMQRAQGEKLTPQLERTLIESLAIEGMARHEALANAYDKSLNRNQRS
jgi:hypothetical protein